VDFKDVNPAFDFKLLEKKLKNDESIWWNKIFVKKNKDVDGTSRSYKFS
jgi:hypothetical protein